MHSLAFVTLGEQVHDRDRYPVIASGISLPSVYELDCRLGEIILPYKYSAEMPVIHLAQQRATEAGGEAIWGEHGQALLSAVHFPPTLPKRQ